jgi:hypothetical protein
MGDAGVEQLMTRHHPALVARQIIDHGGDIHGADGTKRR